MRDSYRVNDILIACSSPRLVALENSIVARPTVISHELCVL